MSAKVSEMTEAATRIYTACWLRGGRTYPDNYLQLHSSHIYRIWYGTLIIIGAFIRC